MATKKKPIKRLRGGATMLCPRCRRPSRVLRTNRQDGAVHRERRCDKLHRFHTTEAVRS